LAAGPQAPSAPQAFLVAPPESAPTATEAAAATPPEAAPATPANAKANARRTASHQAHRQTAKKSQRYNSPFQSFAGNFDPFSGGYRGSSRRYSRYGGGGFNYGSNAN
jgi:hypothetical protein